MNRLLKRLGFLFKFHKSIPFIMDFFRSRQVKGTTKILYVVLIIGYMALPFDLIPDFLYVIGLIDDLTVATILLQRMVKVAPESLKEKYQLK
ncbi:YkvA family protein [Lentibacillus salinarum]|uniref:YkvA family protein n=1 Tax=Lentibacillus salinarum TaxID=446820 RepID=A0ABW3ZUH6_9BACI